MHGFFLLSYLTGHESDLVGSQGPVVVYTQAKKQILCETALNVLTCVSLPLCIL